MVAAMLGRWEEAERHFQLAMDQCAQLGAPPITARVLYERSRMLISRGEEADLASAAELLARAEGICRELDLPGVGNRVAVLATSIDPGRDVDVVGPPAPGAVFRREGDYWTVAYAGQTAHLRDVRGLHYLARLLRRPGREVHVLELVREVEGLPAEPARGLSSGAMLEAGLRRLSLDEAGRLFDPQAKAAYRRRLRDLEEDLEEARSWGDPERAARAREEMDALTEELLREAGLGGRSRALPSAGSARPSATTWRPRFGPAGTAPTPHRGRPRPPGPSEATCRVNGPVTTVPRQVTPSVRGSGAAVRRPTRRSAHDPDPASRATNGRGVLACGDADRGVLVRGQLSVLDR
jgi:hypothetical protein